MRRILVATALAGLLGGGAMIIQRGFADRFEKVVVVAKTTHEPQWRTRVHYDFSNGLGGPVTERGNQLSLAEAADGGGALIQMAHGDGWAVHFPARCYLDPRECPRAILES